MCADAGAHILSIESVGGKEVHDQALLYGDVRGLAFALGVLAARDMRWLWTQIAGICRARPGVIPGGDSACGFANTAMQLAHQGTLPEVLAAADRALSAPRSLAAFEQGAVGPSKVAGGGGVGADAALSLRGAVAPEDRARTGRPPRRRA